MKPFRSSCTSWTWCWRGWILHLCHSYRPCDRLSSITSPPALVISPSTPQPPATSYPSLSTVIRMAQCTQIASLSIVGGMSSRRLATSSIVSWSLRTSARPQHSIILTGCLLEAQVWNIMQQGGKGAVGWCWFLLLRGVFLGTSPHLTPQQFKPFYNKDRKELKNAIPPKPLWIHCLHGCPLYLPLALPSLCILSIASLFHQPMGLFPGTPTKYK